MEKKLINWGIIIFLLVFSSYMFFHGLGKSSLYDYDEARNSENALEILKTGDWMIMHWGGFNEMYNLKPPFGPWMIAIGFIIFGVNEFAARFFSALAGVGLVLTVYFLGRELKNELVGLMAALVLLTLRGFVAYHGAKTADYDVLLTLFISLSIYLFLRYQDSKKIFYLMGSSFSIALAVFTKQAVGFFPVIIIFFYLLYSNSLKEIRWRDYLYSSLFLLIPFSWFLFRLIGDRKFFMKMIFYDLISRGTTTIEGHIGGPDFYFNVIGNNLNWLFILILVMGISLICYNSIRLKNKPFILIIWAAIIFFTFTLAQSKVIWYIIPVYPALCLIMALFLEWLREKIKINQIIFFIVFTLVLSTSLFLSLRIANGTYRSDDKDVANHFKPIIEKANHLYILVNYRSQALIFYLNRVYSGNALFIDKDYKNNFSNGDILILEGNSSGVKLLVGKNFTIADKYGNYYLVAGE